MNLFFSGLNTQQDVCKCLSAERGVKDSCMVSFGLIQTAHLCLRPLGQDRDGVWAEVLLETCPRLRYFSVERLLILLSLISISWNLQKLVRAHSGAGMTCIIRKKQKDDLAKIRLAFSCIYMPLGSVPSLRELPSF